MHNVPQERHIRAAALAAHVYARPMHMPATHKRHIGTRHSIKHIHILYSHPAIKGSGRNRTSRSFEQEEVEGGGGRWSISTRHVHQSCSWLVTRQRLADSVRDLVTCTTTLSTYVGIDLCRYACVTHNQQPADALCATPLDVKSTVSTVLKHRSSLVIPHAPAQTEACTFLYTHSNLALLSSQDDARCKSKSQARTRCTRL